MLITSGTESAHIGTLNTTMLGEQGKGANGLNPPLVFYLVWSRASPEVGT